MEINRELYLERLKSSMHNGLIKVITGIRRVGKSFLLFHIFHDYLLSIGIKESQIIAIEFDDLENVVLRDPLVLFDYVKEKTKSDERYYIILDEVQYVNHFEEVLNSFLHRSNLDVYVTGSNSRFLSSDIITEFRGRGDEIHVYPLSFREYFSSLGGDPLARFREYEVCGGLPGLFPLDEENKKRNYLKSLFETTYIKDIIERNSIRKSDELSELLDVIASSIGFLTNPNRIANTFAKEKHIKIDKATISDFLSYFENAFLIHKAKRYDIKGRKYINTPVKYYFEDVGLRNARLDYRDLYEPTLLENIVYNELRLRDFQVDVGSLEVSERNEKEVNYKALEIDFVANKGNQRFYIQVAQGISDPQKKTQELRGLLRIKDAFPKILIRMDNPISYIDENGIINLSLFDFLLERKTLGFNV